MDKTLKALSLVLSYPTRELQAAMPEIGRQLVGDARFSPGIRRALRSLLDELAEPADVYALEERYVALFDRSRTLSLNLFEHVHGESRERGGALVSLLETYRDGGFEPATCELPDHLPVLLEFLATLTPDAMRETLADAAHILEALKARLRRRKSPYWAAMAALLDLAAVTPDEAAVAELLDQLEHDPDDLEALDAVWTESEVRFGPDAAAGCPPAGPPSGRAAIPIRPVPVQVK